MKLAIVILVVCISFTTCAALDFLTPGFAHVKLNDGSTDSFHVEEYFRVPASLASFHLINIPSHAKISSKPFHLLPEKRINDRDVYFNGQYYLFFIQNVEPHGTWLLGEKLGVDSGVAYFRPEVHTVVPFDMESSTSRWNFLKAGKWTPEKEVRVEALETQVVSRVAYNTISYFVGNELSRSVLLMLPVDKEGLQDGAWFRFSSSLELALPGASLAGKYPVFWSLQTQQWTPFSLHFVIPQAAPVRLISGKTEGVDAPQTGSEDNTTSGGSSQVVHLVGDEANDRGWRLFMRVCDKDAGADLELKLSLTSAGLGGGQRVRSLKANHMSAYVKRLNKKVLSLTVGSYVWLWFRAEAASMDESRYLAFTGGELLLKCVGVSGTAGSERYMFEYHLSHRRKAMDRSVLSMHTSLVSAVWSQEANALQWTLDDSPLMVDALFPLGPDPVTWLREYLVAHEGFLAPGLSSCFMYHGGLSLPPQLIYAAEMVCVLMGAKPMTMIQYTSSADHQWKFPLVPELTRALVAGTRLLPALSAALGVQLNTYQQSSPLETLIFYRTKQRPMLDLILPNNTAQALHIVPFPSEAGENDAAKMDAVLREQIYNSWWNGYLLGYPARFIDSYLKSFHTNLGAGSIQQEILRAERDVRAHFEKHPLLQRGEIGLGSDSDLLADPDTLAYFARVAAGR